MPLLATALPLGSSIFLALAIALALGFEFVNGFHDTANAVATVIYTRTLPPWVAVIWSGCCNLAGVLIFAGPVAFAILALLPAELVLNVGSSAGFAMVFALLISAILWNLGTWYLGLPASSSHTLIGSIMGVGLANSFLNASNAHSIGAGVNWAKAGEVFLALLVSPIIGFVCAAVLLLLAKRLIRQPALFTAPPQDAPPPWWIRALLVLTCTGVSFSHGSNDGQKGMGLVLLILIGIIPGTYALDLHRNPAQVQQLEMSVAAVQPTLDAKDGHRPLAPDVAAAELSRFLQSRDAPGADTMAAIASINRQIGLALAGKTSLEQVPQNDRRSLRAKLYLVGDTIARIDKQHLLSTMGGGDTAGRALGNYKTQIDGVTQFIPTWVKVAVACSLGLGTMIGWKRIVTTVGERIGKDHLTYAQGASAELVVMGTIGLATKFGMPVSTTHVLSSGVAGTMVANGSGLQMATVRNIALAWILTLPVCVLLGSALFAAGLFAVFHTSLTVLIAVTCLAAAAYFGTRWGLFRRVWSGNAAPNPHPSDRLDPAGAAA
jgi:PiT family inorganic phosphate transporter